MCLPVLSVVHCGLIKSWKSKNASGHMVNDWHLDMGEGLIFFFFFHLSCILSLLPHRRSLVMQTSVAGS